MTPRWYVLVHQLPPKPLYLRAKVRQRLGKVGALALKNSVYLLPRTESSLEDFQWIAEEATAGGGEASICEASFHRPEDRELEERFRAERDGDYAALEKDAIALEERLARGELPLSELPEHLPRLARRLSEIGAIDFFSARGRAPAARRIEALEKRARGRRRPPGGEPAPAEALRGKTWVTRRGIQVDRIASAWLVRRFVDEDARFRFVEAGSAAAAPGEIRFDMVGGDFTHESDRCTFETLALRLKLHDAALAAIAEIVHDIDLKDGKFGRPEASGVARLLLGIVLAHPDDETRLARGCALFDDLLVSFRTGAAGAAKKR